VLQFGGGRSRDSRGGGLVFVAQFFAQLIQAAVAREREWLAHASSVQFTRQTAGFAGALKKVAGLPTGSALRDTAAERQVNHMRLGAGKRSSNQLYATHPPLLARIQAREPGFRAEDVEQLRQGFGANPPDGMAEDALLGFVASGPGPGGSPWGRRSPARRGRRRRSRQPSEPFGRWHGGGALAEPLVDAPAGEVVVDDGGTVVGAALALGGPEAGTPRRRVQLGRASYDVAVWTGRPPTHVERTGMSTISAGGTTKGSRPSSTKSASMPGARVPLSRSSPEAYAAPVVYRPKASRTVIRWLSPMAVPSSARRSAQLVIAASGSYGPHG
jgi:hypothetical protein